MQISKSSIPMLFYFARHVLLYFKRCIFCLLYVGVYFKWVDVWVKEANCLVIGLKRRVTAAVQMLLNRVYLLNWRVYKWNGKCKTNQWTYAKFSTLNCITTTEPEECYIPIILISAKNWVRRAREKEWKILGNVLWILQTSQGFLRSVAKNNTLPTPRIHQILSFTAKIN